MLLFSNLLLQRDAQPKEQKDNLSNFSDVADGNRRVGIVTSKTEFDKSSSVEGSELFKSNTTLDEKVKSFKERSILEQPSVDKGLAASIQNYSVLSQVKDFERTKNKTSQTAENKREAAIDLGSATSSRVSDSYCAAENSKQFSFSKPYLPDLQLADLHRRKDLRLSQHREIATCSAAIAASGGVQNSKNTAMSGTHGFDEQLEGKTKSAPEKYGSEVNLKQTKKRADLSNSDLSTEEASPSHSSESGDVVGSVSGNSSESTNTVDSLTVRVANLLREDVRVLVGPSNSKSGQPAKSKNSVGRMVLNTTSPSASNVISTGLSKSSINSKGEIRNAAAKSVPDCQTSVQYSADPQSSDRSLLSDISLPSFLTNYSPKTESSGGYSQSFNPRYDPEGGTNRHAATRKYAQLQSITSPSTLDGDFLQSLGSSPVQTEHDNFKSLSSTLSRSHHSGSVAGSSSPSSRRSSVGLTSSTQNADSENSETDNTFKKYLEPSPRMKASSTSSKEAETKLPFLTSESDGTKYAIPSYHSDQQYFSFNKSNSSANSSPAFSADTRRTVINAYNRSTESSPAISGSEMRQSSGHKSRFEGIKNSSLDMYLRPFSTSGTDPKQSFDGLSGNLDHIEPTLYMSTVQEVTEDDSVKLSQYLKFPLSYAHEVWSPGEKSDLSSDGFSTRKTLYANSTAQGARPTAATIQSRRLSDIDQTLIISDSPVASEIDGNRLSQYLRPSPMPVAGGYDEKMQVVSPALSSLPKKDNKMDREVDFEVSDQSISYSFSEHDLDSTQPTLFPSATYMDVSEDKYNLSVNYGQQAGQSFQTHSKHSSFQTREPITSPHGDAHWCILDGELRYRCEQCGRVRTKKDLGKTDEQVSAGFSSQEYEKWRTSPDEQHGRCEDCGKVRDRSKVVASHADSQRTTADAVPSFMHTSTGETTPSLVTPGYLQTFCDLCFGVRKPRLAKPDENVAMDSSFMWEGASQGENRCQRCGRVKPMNTEPTTLQTDAHTPNTESSVLPNVNLAQWYADGQLSFHCEDCSRVWKMSTPENLKGDTWQTFINADGCPREVFRQPNDGHWFVADGQLKYLCEHCGGIRKDEPAAASPIASGLSNVSHSSADGHWRISHGQLQFRRGVCDGGSSSEESTNVVPQYRQIFAPSSNFSSDPGMKRVKILSDDTLLHKNNIEEPSIFYTAASRLKSRSDNKVQEPHENPNEFKFSRYLKNATYVESSSSESIDETEKITQTANSQYTDVTAEKSEIASTDQYAFEPVSDKVFDMRQMFRGSQQYLELSGNMDSGNFNKIDQNLRDLKHLDLGKVVSDDEEMSPRVYVKVSPRSDSSLSSLSGMSLTERVRTLLARTAYVDKQYLLVSTSNTSASGSARSTPIFNHRNELFDSNGDAIVHGHEETFDSSIDDSKTPKLQTGFSKQMSAEGIGTELHYPSLSEASQLPYTSMTLPAPKEFDYTLSPHETSYKSLLVADKKDELPKIPKRGAEFTESISEIQPQFAERNVHAGDLAAKLMLGPSDVSNLTSSQISGDTYTDRSMQTIGIYVGSGRSIRTVGTATDRTSEKTVLSVGTHTEPPQHRSMQTVHTAVPDRANRSMQTEDQRADHIAPDLSIAGNRDLAVFAHLARAEPEGKSFVTNKAKVGIAISQTVPNTLQTASNDNSFTTPVASVKRIMPVGDYSMFADTTMQGSATLVDLTVTKSLNTTDNDDFSKKQSLLSSEEIASPVKSGEDSVGNKNEPVIKAKSTLKHDDLKSTKGILSYEQAFQEGRAIYEQDLAWLQSKLYTSTSGVVTSSIVEQLNRPLQGSTQTGYPATQRLLHSSNNVMHDDQTKQFESFSSGYNADQEQSKSLGQSFDQSFRHWSGDIVQRGLIDHGLLSESNNVTNTAVPGRSTNLDLKSLLETER